MALSGHSRCLLLRGTNKKNISFLELCLYFLRLHCLPIEGVLALHIPITIRVYDNCPHKYITADERKEVAEAVATRNSMLVAYGNIRASEDIVHIKSVLRKCAIRCVRESMSEHQHGIGGQISCCALGRAQWTFDAECQKCLCVTFDKSNKTCAVSGTLIQRRDAYKTQLQNTGFRAKQAKGWIWS